MSNDTVSNLSKMYILLRLGPIFIYLSKVMYDKFIHPKLPLGRQRKKKRFASLDKWTINVSH